MSTSTDTRMCSSVHQQSASRNGTTYLLRGRPSSADTTISSIPDRYDGPPTASSSGWALTGLGDVNGDGAGDFAIGAPAASKGGTNTGSVYVIYGKPAPTPPKVTPSPAPRHGRLPDCDGAQGAQEVAAQGPSRGCAQCGGERGTEGPDQSPSEASGQDSREEDLNHRGRPVSSTCAGVRSQSGSRPPAPVSLR